MGKIQGRNRSGEGERGEGKQRKTVMSNRVARDDAGGSGADALAIPTTSPLFHLFGVPFFHIILSRHRRKPQPIVRSNFVVQPIRYPCRDWSHTKRKKQEP